MSNAPTGPAPAGRQLTPADFGWDGEVMLPDLWDQLTEPRAVVTFSALVFARMRSRKPAVRDEARAAERALRTKFIDQHGPIQCATYAKSLLGGCAITEQVEGTGRAAVPVRRLHTVLSTGVPQLVELEARCSALADDTITAFGGRRSLLRQMRALTDAVYSALTRVLRAADELSTGEIKDPRRRELIRLASSECAHAERQVNKAIQRQARLTYFQGTLAGAAATMALCAALGAVGMQWWSGSIQTSSFLASIVFGALGAVASVSQRISTGKLVLDFTVSRWQMLALGGLRPLVGAVFGAVAHFGLAAGVFGSVANSAEQTAAVGFSAVVGFAAGFSERLATDMVERAGRVASTDATAPEQPPAAAT